MDDRGLTRPLLHGMPKPATLPVGVGALPLRPSGWCPEWCERASALQRVRRVARWLIKQVGNALSRAVPLLTVEGVHDLLLPPEASTGRVRVHWLWRRGGVLGPFASPAILDGLHSASASSPQPVAQRRSWPPARSNRFRNLLQGSWVYPLGPEAWAGYDSTLASASC
jgi:hypothetical protein